VSQHHDPVHPEASHLDTEVIADLQVGALDDESAAHAQAHLDDCPQCQEVAAALTAVTQTLAGLPRPEVPADVAARWTSALAAEPLLVPAGGGATVVPMAQRDATTSSAWAGRGLAIAAAAAGLLLVAALAYPMLSGGGDTNGSQPLSAAGGSSTPTFEAAAMPTALTSGTAYRTASLDTQVATELTAYESPAQVSITPSPSLPDPSGGSTDSATTAETGSPTPTLTTGQPGPLLAVDRAALLSCLSGVVPAGSVPLLVDVATYQGQPAVIIVVPTDTDSSKMDVYVVARHCTATDVRLLYWLRTDRP